jgi:hypothetical protein
VDAKDEEEEEGTRCNDDGIALFELSAVCRESLYAVLLAPGCSINGGVALLLREYDDDSNTVPAGALSLLGPSAGVAVSAIASSQTLRLLRRVDILSHNDATMR